MNAELWSLIYTTGCGEYVKLDAPTARNRFIPSVKAVMSAHLGRLGYTARVHNMSGLKWQTGRMSVEPYAVYMI